MREPYGEGPASHTGAETCVVGRNAQSEALTGEDAGEPGPVRLLSHPGLSALIRVHLCPSVVPLSSPPPPLPLRETPLVFICGHLRNLRTMLDAGVKPQAASCKLQARSYEPRAPSGKLQATSRKLQAASCEPRAASGEPQACLAALLGTWVPTRSSLVSAPLRSCVRPVFRLQSMG